MQLHSSGLRPPARFSLVFAVRMHLMRALLVLSMIALAGCGAVSSTSSSSDTLELPSSSAPTTCNAFMSGHDARVSFVSNTLLVAAECRTFIQAEAKAGYLWSPAGAAAPTVAIICNLNDAQGNVSALVLDSGAAIYGKAACTTLLASGWVDAG